MKKLISLFAVGMMMTGCLVVRETDKTFAVSAKKILIGADFADASMKIPEGATTLHIVHQEGPLGLGLISITYIAGTK